MSDTKPFFHADLLAMNPIEVDQYVMAYFGMHYEELDFYFRKKEFHDPIARRGLVVGDVVKPFAAEPYPMASQMMATVSYDTVSMTYLRIEYCGPHGVRSIDLRKMKL
jgi:hypothetical protein